MFQNWREYINNLLKPKLGQLYQYSPRIMHIPFHYHRLPKITKWPSISLVTPAFRHGDFIETTIKSILDQQYPCLEYVIKDGGSTDNTINILHSYEDKLTYWESTKDTGQSNAINVGFTHTSGDIMAYLNSDDLLLPGSLHYVAHYFENHPEVDLVYGHRILIDENNLEIGRWVIPPHQDKVLPWADYIPQETLFWRRELWEKVGGKIDESFQFAMDWDLLLRFKKIGAKFVRLPRFLGAFRIHPSQKTSAAISDIGVKEMQRLRERELGKEVTYQEINQNIQQYLRIHQCLHVLYTMNLIRY